MFAGQTFPASGAGEIATRLSSHAADEEKSCFQPQRPGWLFSQGHRGQRRFNGLTHPEIGRSIQS
jgi:hypothetical protein